MRDRVSVYALRAALAAVLILSALLLVIATQKSSDTEILKGIYGDNYSNINGEHFYIYKGVEINLNGTDESLICSDAQYELVYNGLRTMSSTDERNGMPMLDFALVNKSDRTLTVTTEYSVEMDIGGKWYRCMAAGNGLNSAKDDIPAGESIAKSFGLAFRPITADDTTVQLMPFPPGRYRLLKEIESQYIVLEFSIPE